MSKTEIEHLFGEETFNPVVVTTKDGFALSVERSRDVLVGFRAMAVKHNGLIYNIPFHAIAHISEKGDTLG